MVAMCRSLSLSMTGGCSGIAVTAVYEAMATAPGRLMFELGVFVWLSVYAAAL
jgi:hypothetical protein